MTGDWRLRTGTGRPWLISTTVPSVVATVASVLLLWLLRRLENARPVELDVGVVLLEQTDRVFVDRRAADADAGRRAEEIQETLPAAAPAGAAARQERGAFIAALVPGKSQVRQGALSPCA